MGTGTQLQSEVQCVLDTEPFLEPLCVLILQPATDGSNVNTKWLDVLM